MKTTITIPRLLQQHPRVYGLLYLALIPIYACLYYAFPSITGSERPFVECLYFSIVTITTLGYGDITPLDPTGQLVTASESLFGVISIGLFLNAIASARSDRVRQEQAERDAAVYRESQRAKLNGHYRLMLPVLELYRIAVMDITSRTTGNEPMQYNPDFELKDLKDLHKPAILLRGRFQGPAAIGYFDALELLHEEFADLIKNVDLRCFPAIQGHTGELLSAMTSDLSRAILPAARTKAADRPLAVEVEEMLEQYQGDYVLEGSNIDSYIALYHQIKTVMRVSARMEREIQKEIRGLD